MQYTPQQLAGGVKYNNKVRIGNWKEDIELEEQKLKDFEVRRSHGELLLTKTSKKLSIATQSVPHTYSTDGNLHYGDQLVLGHDIGSIACNIWESFNIQGDTVASVIPTTNAMARNTFQILKPALLSTDGDRETTIRYGVPFVIASNASLSICPRTGLVKKPYYLSSELKSAMRQARLSSKQEVCFARKESYSTLWIAIPRNPDMKLRLEGTPVPANEPVLIIHKATNTPLAAETKFSFKTEFGAEYELFAGAISGLKKVYGLVAEKLGKRASDMVEPAPQQGNVFAFVTSKDPRDSEDHRDLHPMNADTTIQLVKATILDKGVNCFRGLARVFKILDNKKRGTISKEEFKYGLNEYGIELDQDEFDLLFSNFDLNRDGTITFKEFISVLRGPPSEERKKIIRMAYNALDKDGSGTITLRDIELAYNAKNHPEVLAGRKTEKDVHLEFLSGWDTQKKDGTITWEEFVEYYTDISAAIEDDRYFELLLRNAWHIAGGTGASENTANLRVLVTYSDDRPDEVIGVVNDLGLDHKDTPSIIQRLEAQGVKNIKSISLK